MKLNIKIYIAFDIAFDPILTLIRGFDKVQHKNSSIYREREGKGKAKDHGAGLKKRRENSDQLKISLSPQKANRSIRSEQRRD